MSAAKKAKAEWKWLKVIYGKLDKIDKNFVIINETIEIINKDIIEIRKRVTELEQK